MEKIRNSEGLTFEEYTAIKKAKESKNIASVLRKNEKGELVNSDGLTFDEFNALKKYESGTKTDIIKIPSLKQDRSKLGTEYDEYEFTYNPESSSKAKNITASKSKQSGVQTITEAITGPAQTSRSKDLKNVTADDIAVTMGKHEETFKSKKLADSMPDAEEYANKASAALSSEDIVSASGKRLESTVKKLEELETLTGAYTTRLQYLESEYNKNPTEENATKFNEIFDLREAAIEEHDSLLLHLKDYEAINKSIITDYNSALGGYEKAYGEWRASIRESGVVGSELEATDAAVSALESKISEVRARQQTINSRSRLYLSEKNKETLKELDDELEEYNIALTPLLQKKAELSEELGYAKDIEQAEYYASYTGKADFAENSKYKPGKTGESAYNGFTSLYNIAYKDVAYEIINGNEEVILMNNTNNMQLDNSHKDDYLTRFTEEEKAIYNYIHATEGKEAADKFIEMLTPTLNERNRLADEEYWTEKGKTDPVGVSFVSVLLNLGKGKALIGQAGDYLEDGKIDENAAYNYTSYASSAMREGVSSGMNGFGSFLYQTGMSLADFLAATAVSGGTGFSLAIMGSGAAADTTIAAKDRGLSDGQAVALGAAAGIIEIVTEKVSLDALFDKLKLGKDAVSYLISNTLAEAGEEISSELLNDAVDVLVAKDKSEWNEAINAYLAKGVGQKEALLKAFGDQAIEVGLSGLGGALSGAAIGAPGAAVKTYKRINHQKTVGKNVLEAEGGLDSLLKEALNYPKYTKGYKLAEKISKKIKAGGKATAAEVGGLTEIWLKRQLNAEALSEIGKLAREGKSLETVEETIRDSGYDVDTIAYAEIENAYSDAVAAAETERKLKATSSLELTQPLEAYPADKQKTITEFANSVDERIVEFIEESRDSGEFSRLNLDKLSSKAVEDISDLVGFSVDGYITAINTNATRHIEARHGENGSQDHTMANTEDIARLTYVIDKYDSVEILTDDDGNQVLSEEFRNADNTEAQMLRFSKKIDGTYYVVEAVPDSSYKKMWVVSAYTSKKGVTQESNAANATLNTTPEAHLVSPPDNSIPQNSDSDNTSSENNSDDLDASTENDSGSDIAAVNKIKNAIPELSEMDSVISLTGNEFPKSSKKLTEQVGEFFASLKNKITRKGFGEVVISNDGIKSSIAHGLGRAKAVTFAAVPDVIASGKQIDYQENWKGRGYNTYIFAAPVQIGEKTGYVGAVVTQSEETNKYYLHEVVDSEGNIFKISKDADLFKTGSFTDNSASTSKLASSDNSIPQKSDSDNTSSENNSDDLDASTENEITKHKEDIADELRWHNPRDVAVSKFYSDEAAFDAKLKAEGKLKSHPSYHTSSETVRSGYVYGARESEIAIADRLSKALGRDILFFSEDARNENIKNGVFDRDVIWINARHDPDKTVTWIIAHELTHTIEDTKAYDKLKDYVFDILGEEDVKRQRTELLDLYDRREIDYEIVSNYVADHLLTDEAAIMKLVQRNRSLGQKIKSVIANILDKLGKANKKTEEYLAVEKFYKTYQKALAEQANAQNTDGAASEVERAKEKVTEPDDALKDDYIKNARERFMRGEITQAELNRLVNEYFDENTDRKIRYSFSKANKIHPGMNDSERAMILERKNLTVYSYNNIDPVTETAIANLRGKYISESKHLLKELGEKCGIFDIEYLNDDIDLSFRYSRTSFGESINKQPSRSNDAENFGKMLSLLPEICKNAVEIESHTDKYIDTAREDPNLKEMHILLGAFADGDSIVPVQLEIKEFKSDSNKKNKLYLTVTLHKKEAGISPRDNDTSFDKETRVRSTPASVYSISDFIANVNDNTGDLIKYFPDSMLTAEQIEVKNKVLGKDSARIEKMRREYAEANSQSFAETAKKSVSGTSDTLTEFAEKTRSEYLEVTEKLNAKSREYLERREREFVRRIGEVLHLSPDTKRGIVRDVARGIIAEQIGNGAVTEDVARELFEYAYNEGTVKDDEYYNQYKELKNYLRNTAITISKQDRSDLGDWKAFRQSARGKLKLWYKNGLPVDSAYMELMEMYPELFPAEITHPADQLQRMLTVANGIRVNEISLDEHFGENAEEAKDWMWNDFNQAVTDFTREIGFGKNYIENLAERMAKEGIVVPNAETLFETYKNLKKLRADASKAVARNVLTPVEENYVRDLLIGRLTLDQIPAEHYNVDGIKDVYEAKLPYEYASKVIEAYHNKRKSDQYARADELLEGFEDWKTVKRRFTLSTNTMERNFYNMIKDTDRAQAMIDEYIAPIYKREAQSTRYKNKFLDKIRALNISQKVAKGNRDTEAAAVQFIGEAESHIMRLESNKRLDKSGGMTLEEWQKALSDFKIANPELDYKRIGDCIRTFREIYNQLFDDMNKARMLNGYEPIDYRYAYFPHFHKDIPTGFWGKFAEVLGVPQDTQNLPATIAGMTENFKPGIRWLSAAQERRLTDTEYDCLEGFDRYIGGAADVIFHTESIQKLRSLANRIRYQASDEAIREKIQAIEDNAEYSDEDKHEKIAKIAKSKFSLSTFINELDEYTNLLAGKKSRADRQSEQDMDRNFYNWAAWLKRHFGANVVAGNIGSAMTNFIPIAQAAGITKHQMLKAMYAQIKSMAVDDGFADRSDFLTNRIVGTDTLSKKTSDKISDILGTPTELIDGFSSGTIVRALYAQAKKNGLSDAEAMAQANTRAAEIMADRSKGAMPTIFSRSNFLTGIFTQFQLEVANQYNYMFKDIPRYYSGDKRKMLKVIFSLFKIFILSYLFNDIYEALVGRRPAFDPIDIVNNAIGDATGYQLPNMFDAVGDIIDGEDFADVFETEKKGAAKAVEEAVTGAAEEIPFIGGLLGGGRIPISSAIPDLEKLYDTFTGDASVKKKLKTLAGELASLLYVLPPFGGGQVKKTLDAIPSIVQGGSYTYDNDGNRRLQYPTQTGDTVSDVLEAGRSLVFGKSSSRYAREWVEGGFSTLSAKQTREYEKLIEAGYPKADAMDMAKAIVKLPENDKEVYEKLLGEGFEVDDAFGVVQKFSELKPINGKSSVSDIQKAEVVIDSVENRDSQMKVLEGVVGESTYRDMSFAYSEWSVPPYQFIEAEAAIDAVMHEQGKTRESQDIVEEALRRCEMYDARRAALWQILTKSKKPENNPFDVDTANQVLEDYEKYAN